MSLHGTISLRWDLDAFAIFLPFFDPRVTSFLNITGHGMAQVDNLDADGLYVSYLSLHLPVGRMSIMGEINTLFCCTAQAIPAELCAQDFFNLLTSEDEYWFEASSALEPSEESSDHADVLLDITEGIASYNCVGVYSNESYGSPCVRIARPQIFHPSTMYP